VAPRCAGALSEVLFVRLRFGFAASAGWLGGEDFDAFCCRPRPPEAGSAPSCVERPAAERPFFVIFFGFSVPWVSAAGEPLRSSTNVFSSFDPSFERAGVMSRDGSDLLIGSADSALEQFACARATAREQTQS
jgi:hypothetical protein